MLQQVRYANGAIHGASGVIQYSPNPTYHGNLIGVIIPILNIEPTKTTTTVSTGWSTWSPGTPLPSDGC